MFTSVALNCLLGSNFKFIFYRMSYFKLFYQVSTLNLVLPSLNDFLRLYWFEKILALLTCFYGVSLAGYRMLITLWCEYLQYVLNFFLLSAAYCRRVSDAERQVLAAAGTTTQCTGRVSAAYSDHFSVPGYGRTRHRARPGSLHPRAPFGF